MKSTTIKIGISSSVVVLTMFALLTPRTYAEKLNSNVPKAVGLATDLGRVDPTKEINLTVVLKLHNEAEYDKEVEALYDPASPTYHHWFTAQDFARFAPTASELETVKKELTAHGLTVIDSDPDRFSVRVHGIAANAESAFQTEIHTLRFNGKTFDAHVSEARLGGAAGELVSSVSGLERHQVNPNFTLAKNLRTGQTIRKKPLTKSALDGGFLSTITDKALTAPQLFTYTTEGAPPLGIYYGNAYDLDPTLTVAFTPSQLQDHYGLTPLISSGYDGTGQTIALVEAYGYSAAEADANAAATLFGLPALTSSNFSMVYPEGKPISPIAADLTGWTEEIALDIQSAHGIAPGAKIVVVASAGQDNEDQIASLQYIIKNKVANTVSSSWENDSEIISGPAEENAFNSVLKKGAAAGISFQFSSGDGGDQGLGSPVGAVSVPSNSPYATAVGGTTILNDPTEPTHWTVAGWGNNATYIALGGAADPPFELGFLGGAGGGESIFYAKPSWQKALPGTGRQVPDVSALADPYTGFSIVYTYNGTQYIQAGIGGTSLASPIFTAIWAIADQYNGKPLGLAGPAVAKLKTGQITDVVPSSVLNVSDPAGTVYDSSGATFYSAKDLFSGLLYSQTRFPSAVWQFDSQDAAVLSFGTDSSLTVTPGWDNVTGFGEPNGLPFIQGVTGKTTGAVVHK
jgi:subtilase family serine protease